MLEQSYIPCTFSPVVPGKILAGQFRAHGRESQSPGSFLQALPSTIMRVGAPTSKSMR